MGITRFIAEVTLDTRGLAIHGDLYVTAVTGKGKRSGWDELKAALKKAGFRVTSRKAEGT